MPDVFYCLPYNTISPSLNKLRWVEVKVDTKPSLYSCPIDMGASDCRWGNMFAVLAAWVKRGFRLISSLLMAWTILPSGSMTWGSCVIGCLLLYGVFTLMYFWVSLVSAMPYCSGLVGGWLLHVFLFWPKSAKFSKLSSLWVTFILLVGDLNRQRPCGNPKVLPPDLFVAVSSVLWPEILLLNSSPVWPPDTWI